DVAKEFWDGYSSTFVEHKNQIDDHVCERDVSVYECGKVAAFLTLIYGQCGKITCGKCAKRVAEMSLGEYSDAVLKEMERLSPFMSKSLASFEHVQQFVDVTKNIASHSKMNYDAFTENIRLIGDRSDAPYSHLLNLNNGIVKLLHSSDGDATRLAEELRQLVRWHKNRIEHVKTGSLATFRNKILAKNQLNLSLLCDNQRDQNGNFVWGLRGAAVNRFFKNYFTEVVVGGKYEQYQVRHNPRGSRQLAIGHLVMPTDLAVLRGQLKGERIDQGPVGENCISRLHGNFLNPCCCVTHDNGVAYESAYMAPTKHHLVVGSPIDPKYIDLPQGKKPGMYIPKEGYCYILIFIAMLLNVEEEKAKQFTKIVRDVLVPKLGTWPKMIDVATACHFLSILHPDTRTAEIPRILVDHQKQILHVIDSYGSATSGFHYLKAGTVAQLILFANDDLQSEIKDYLVG
nr:HC-Pro [Hippeastrum mosaic virus]